MKPPPGAVGRATAATFAGLSRLRGKRIVHPKGLTFAARWEPATPNPLGLEVLEGGPRPAVARISRATGVREPLPDVIGLAFRIPDAYGARRHQDVLLVTSGHMPVTRHLLLPARRMRQRTYSSLLPYRVSGRLLVVGSPQDSRSGGPSVGELAGLPHPALRFPIAVSPLRGSWTRVADLVLEERLEQDVNLDPANSGGGLEPATWLNHLRPAAYAGSRHGRGAPRAPF